jgi:DNA-binding NarL/FixJ family response regulator
MLRFHLNVEGYSLIDCRPTVLFADDSHMMLEAACALLQPTHNVVKLATNGREAVLWVMKLQPDLAVFDICLPEMDGIAAARKLNEAGTSTRVILIAPIKDEDYICEARLVAHGFVLKRRLASDLVPALTSAVAGSFFLSQ